MAMDDEPRALAVDILNEIISYIKQSRPTKTDGTSTQGFVYAQQNPGQMISPRDFSRPWSPLGTASAPAVSGPPPAGGTAPPPANPSEETKRAMRAASNTATLFDTLLMITDDSTMMTYGGGGRHLSFAYPGILQAMECAPLPERTPETQARIDAATAVLWDASKNKTKLYASYLANQLAYAKAKADFVINQNKMLADPLQADSAPILLAPYQTAVDQAWDQWKSQGADEVESALATVESLGVPLEQGMIANARKLMDAWSVNLAGLAAKVPYVSALPTEWAAIEIDDIGWTKITKDATSYKSHFEQHGYDLSTGNWSGESSSTSGSAGVGIFGFGFSGSHSESDSSSGSAFSTTGSDGTVMRSDATDLHVELEYGLVQIVRPWLVTDLFRMRNWYLRGEQAGVISDGTIANQVGKDKPLLPMIPTHVLVVRNVKISTSSWGSVRDTLTTYWSKNTASSSSSSSSTSGGVSIPVFGPFSVSGGFSHSDSRYQGDFKDEAGNDCRDDYGSYFEGDTLCINGAQIVAWLGEIIPSSPPLADPSLATG